MAGRISNFFNRFPKVYWTVLSFELLERGAYYAMMPILATHFHVNVGLPFWFGAILTVFMYPFQYGMPIISSAWAEKLGYRKQMIIGFSILTAAYIFLSFANSIPTAIIGVMLLGFGIGCYKPLVSSTIAKATEQKDRNYAYSIYYWIVNFAATFFALGWTGLLLLGVMTEAQYAWIFRISSLFFVINILVAVFIFREVPRSGQVKTSKDVFRNVKTAFADRKFLVMVLLIAGFWSLYATTLAPFQLIMVRFHFLPDGFPIMLLGVFNPLTIIILGFPLAKYVEKIESLKAVMGGVLVYLIGMAIVAFFLESFWLVVLGIVIYSIGEFMVAPGYLAFVSKLAPKEKVSAYIGANFLATFFGIFGGALIWGLLSSYLAEGLHRPHMFYGIVLSAGLLVLFGFIVYYKAWGQDIIERAKKIQELEEGVKDSDFDKVVAAHSKPKRESILYRIFDMKGTPIVSVLLVPVMLISTYSLGTNYLFPAVDDKEEITPFNIEDYDPMGGPLFELDDYATDGQPLKVEDYSIPEKMVASVTFKLTWTDEPNEGWIPQSPGHENQPDTFTVDIQGPTDGLDAADTGTNEQGREGVIEFTMDVPVTEDGALNGTGDWEITISVDAGNHQPVLGVGIPFDDGGNDFALEITYMYYELK